MYVMLVKYTPNKLNRLKITANFNVSSLKPEANILTMGSVNINPIKTIMVHMSKIKLMRLFEKLFAFSILLSFTMLLYIGI